MRFLLSLFFFCLSVAAFGQNQRVMQGAAAQFPCVDTPVQRLFFLLGDWSVASEYRLPDGSWEKTTASSRFEKALNGCLVREFFAGTRAGKAFVAEAQLGYADHFEVFQRNFVDVEHRLQVLYQGTWQEDSLILDSSLEIRGQTVQFRHLYRQISDKSFLFESARSHDGTTWRVSWRMTYTRL